MEKLVIEAERLSKEMKIDFRQILDYLYKEQEKVLTVENTD